MTSSDKILVLCPYCEKVYIDQAKQLICDTCVPLATINFICADLIRSINNLKTFDFSQIKLRKVLLEKISKDLDNLLKGQNGNS